LKGVKVLAEYLGDVEAERFIALIQREPFDYTKWRQDMDEDGSITDLLIIVSESDRDGLFLLGAI